MDNEKIWGIAELFIITIYVFICLSLTIIWKRKITWRYLSDFTYIQFINFGNLISGLSLMIRTLSLFLHLTYMSCYLLDLLRELGYNFSYISCLALYELSLDNLINYD
jgi:hypothetical protein